jgi:flagellar basal body-associated protein FliL
MDFRPQSQPEHNPQPVATTPAAPGKKKKNMMKMQKQTVMWLLIVILLIVAFGTAAFFMKKYNESQKQVDKLNANPTLTAQQQQADLIAKVGKLTVLPTNETPTVATVTDITKLKDQAFFTNAQNGDKVLIYTQAKEAYLYRPSTNKIINIAPVNLGSNQTSTTGTTPTQSTTQTVKKP